jgi:cytochrome c553
MRQILISLWLPGCFATWLIAAAVGQAQQPESDSGLQLYQNQCASCHGAAGQGGDGFSDPLVGDLSLPELTRYIDQTMPEEDPESVTGQQARQVAEFVFDEFYSEQAQRRAAQPRIELARLTVNQYRNSVADLIASFGKSVPRSDDRGLKASYFASRRRSKDRKIADQVDAVLDFPRRFPTLTRLGNTNLSPNRKRSPLTR